MTVPLPPAGDADWYDWAAQVHDLAHGAAQADDLDNVATSGAAADLSGLATVATTGSAADLTGTLADARIPAAITRDTELAAHTGNTSNPHAVTKAQVGLGNADNTADTAKPVSTATTAALGGKADKSTLTAKGDLYAATGSATPARLAVGTDGSILTVDSTAPTNLAWRSPSTATITNPLAELNTTKLRLSRIEGGSLPSGTQYDLLDVTGPGVVESVWVAVDKTAAIDGRLRVYYDGSSTPTIDIDAGTLWASHYSPPNPVNTPHMAFDQKPDAGTSNFPSGYFMSFPIPFGTQVKIAYFSPSGATAAFYSQVAYRLTATDAAGGKRLRAAGFRYADQAVTRASGATTTLANITGGAGSLVWHSYVGGAGASNLTWMERNIEFTIDGEGSPSILATGTEDWFDGAWYFGAGRSSVNTSIHSYVATDKPIGATNVVGMATDLLSKWGGIPFNNSCLVRALPEAACTTGDTFVSCFLYYQ